jgi:hypothetical protein
VLLETQFTNENAKSKVKSKAISATGLGGL